MLADEVQKLRQELAEKEEQLRNQQRNCQHNWTDPVYDPEIVQKFVCTGYAGVGSDPYPTGHYVPKEVDRWSRKCRTCGLVQYTKQLVPNSIRLDFK